MSKSSFIVIFTLIMAFVTGSVWVRTIIDRPIRDRELANLKLNADSLRLYAVDQADTLFKDSLIVVNIWATWCKPCLEEIPDLNMLKKDFTINSSKSKNKPVKIKFLALTDENYETIRDWEQERKKKNLPMFEYTILPKQKALLEYLMRKNMDKNMPPGKGQTGIPANIIIHRNEVKYFVTGVNSNSSFNLKGNVMKYAYGAKFNDLEF